ncbi:hypothetical protein Ae201684P_009509 [Aphanomyces euteiches]|uniref:Uncharacterized protein n=1 Tax=Aphanomyces euteiches TaxID=100861 RepID=A0A6G0W4S4_9STRA|nr:hypothetical protein Ae201684_019149 [Aphanomyces euteiches]KAF0727958.1 hypothetical protein Ae201684_014069 [Aphanomyces euteiches]KAH9096252.1 hypothetical protein Ae201684P_009487 [Aphanomyces euteiches]KAH9096275.1 hypothetical protein Ae201684P_009509 [Aphanomyces euteiches]
MGNAPAIPIVGEVVTCAEALGKTVAVGACAIAGDSKGADKFIKSSGQSFENYADMNPIVANTRVAIAAANNDDREVQRLCKRQEDAWIGIVDSTPVVGHVKGVVHLALGDNERAEACLIGATRSAVVVAASVATAGAGAVACGTATRTDAVTTGINSASKGEFAPVGMIAACDRAAKTGDAIDVFNSVAIPVSDFAFGAIAAKMKAKSRRNENQPSNESVRSSADSGKFDCDASPNPETNATGAGFQEQPSGSGGGVRSSADSTIFDYDASPILETNATSGSGGGVRSSADSTIFDLDACSNPKTNATTSTNASAPTSSVCEQIASNQTIVAATCFVVHKTQKSASNAQGRQEERRQPPRDYTPTLSLDSASAWQ